MKRKKLNSRNPKFTKKTEQKVKEKRLIVDLLFAKVYAVFYEN